RSTGNVLRSSASRLLKNSSRYTARRRSSMPAGGGFRSGSRMCAASSRCFSWNARASGTGGCLRHRLAGTRLQRTDLPHLGEQLAERREIEIALEQRGQRPEALVGMREQRPRGVTDGAAVGVDAQVLGLDVVAGDVQV